MYQYQKGTTGTSTSISVLGFDHTTRGFAQVRTDHWANQRRRGSREIKNCLFSTSGTTRGQISKLLFGVLVVPLMGATYLIAYHLPVVDTVVSGSVIHKYRYRSIF